MRTRIGAAVVVVVAVAVVAIATPLAQAGRKEGIAAYKRGDWAAALAELSPLAEEGDALAQFYVGYMYESGKGVEADLEHAARLYRAAAEQGEEKAQFNLAAALESGRGVTLDLTEAHSWYLDSAERGFPRAQYKVAEMFESGVGTRQDLVQAYKWFAICGKQRYEDARKRRRRVAKRMDPYDIAEADLQVRLWRQTHD
jgi:TPR repeat protein